MNEKAVSIILLAAGGASRMGRPKQLLPWKGGFLLQERLEAALASNAGEVVLVLGAYSERIRQALGSVPGLIIKENGAWKKGLGSSIGCGMQYIKQRNSRVDGVLLMLGDQPLIQTAYLNEMIRVFGEEKKQIVASRYSKNVGVPALFGREYFDRLGTLDDDTGAKNLIRENASDIRPMDPGTDLLDIDSPEDYEYLSGRSLE